MIRNNFIKKPQTSSNLTCLLKPKIVQQKKFNAKQKKKIETKFDKQNQSCLANYESPEHINMIDLKKKIKKISHPVNVTRLRFVPVKSFQEDQEYQECQFLLGNINGVPCYKDQALGFDEQFRNMLEPQRIDNDVITDDQQIQSGIRKLRNALQQACKENQQGMEDVQFIEKYCNEKVQKQMREKIQEQN